MKLNNQKIHNILYKRAIGNFLKAVIHNKIQNIQFKDNISIIFFINSFDKNIKISYQRLYNIKTRAVIFKPITNTKKIIKFIDYIKIHFPQFNEQDFYNLENLPVYNSIVVTPSTGISSFAEKARTAITIPNEQLAVETFKLNNYNLVLSDVNIKSNSKELRYMLYKILLLILITLIILIIYLNIDDIIMSIYYIDFSEATNYIKNDNFKYKMSISSDNLCKSSYITNNIESHSPHINEELFSLDHTSDCIDLDETMKNEAKIIDDMLSKRNKSLYDIFNDENIGEDIANLFTVDKEEIDGTIETPQEYSDDDSSGSRTPTQADYMPKNVESNNTDESSNWSVISMFKQLWNGSSVENIENSQDVISNSEFESSVESKKVKLLLDNISYNYQSHKGNLSQELNLENESWESESKVELDSMNSSTTLNTTTNDDNSLKNDSPFTPFTPNTLSELKKEAALVNDKLQNIVNNLDNRELTEEERSLFTELIEERKYLLDQESKHISSLELLLDNDKDKANQLVEETENLLLKVTKLKDDAITFSDKINQDILTKELKSKLNVLNLPKTETEINSAASEGLGSWRENLSQQEQKFVDSIYEPELKKQIKIRIEKENLINNEEDLGLKDLFKED